jgi:hypothetical protein
VLIVLMILAAASFLASAITAVMVLRPREYRYAGREQLREEWENYRDDPDRTTAQVLGMLADQLICGGDGEKKSPVDSLADDAQARGHLVARSVGALLVGLVLLVAVATILFFEVPR